jgi:hypothetical protein
MRCFDRRLASSRGLPVTKTRPSLLIALGLTLTPVGCGEKPKPRSPPVPTAPQPTNPPTTPEPPPALERTPGGIELNPLVPEGPEGLAIIDAAKNLARDKTAISRLKAAGPTVKSLVIALLASQSLDEVLAALDLIAAENDPTTARAAIAADITPLVALLGHEVREVRDRAWQVAPLVANGEVLVALLDKANTPETKRGVIRLLAEWDSPAVRDGLARVIRGADRDLASEAVLALARPDRDKLEEAATLAIELCNSEETRVLGLSLAHRLPQAALKAHAAPLTKAIDAALADRSTSPDALSPAIRAAANLPRSEHLPLLVQLAGDPDPTVQRVALETLGTLGGDLGQDAIAAVDKALDDLEGEVRIAAVRTRAALALAPSKTPESLEKAASTLVPKLSEGHQGVRLAAVAVLAAPDFAPWSAEPLKGRVTAETGPSRELVLTALASSKHRTLASIVVDKLTDSDLRPAAHLALTTAAGRDLPADVGSWQAWLDSLGPTP